MMLYITLIFYWADIALPINPYLKKINKMVDGHYYITYVVQYIAFFLFATIPFNFKKY